jgi:hypothetical protein
MDALEIRKPTLKQPYVSTYTKDDEDRMQRRCERANELGIKLFVLDEDDKPKEFQELEYFIIDNYIDMDIDVPDDIKKKYLDLKLQIKTAVESMLSDAKKVAEGKSDYATYEDVFGTED